MTDALTDAIKAATAAVAAIDDPVERYQAARRAKADLTAGDRALKAIQQDVVNLLREGRTWAEVGEMVGASGSWVEALAKGRKSRR